MKRLLGFSVFVALALTGNATFAADECAKITATGHPQYPVIAYKDGDNIVGAAPSLVEAIGKAINVPVESKYMGTWEEAQAAARDGKADMIFGIYYNDERATYLDYVQPAFTYDDVAVFVVKGKEFPFKDKSDLIGKKGVTNQGESYGTEFDAFMKDKLDVARAAGIDAAFKRPDRRKGRLFDCRLLSGSCRGGQRRDQGQGRAARPGAPLPGDVRCLFQEIGLPLLSGQVRAADHRDDDG